MKISKKILPALFAIPGIAFLFYFSYHNTVPGGVLAEPVSPGQAGKEALEWDISSVERGKRVFEASGGCGCHTDPNSDQGFLGGGRAIRTPFGTMYGTNITPHQENGIGSYTEEDFIAAMRHGTTPDGSHLFPVFPYTSFGGMTDRDLKDLFSYLKSIEPVDRKNQANELYFPFSFRFMAGLWKWLFFEPSEFRADPSQSEMWNRGKYLTDYVGHCAECHTPRNLFGALDRSRMYVGSKEGAEGEPAPNITPDKKTGMGNYSEEDFVFLMTWGFKRDGEDVMGLMKELIEDGYSRMSKEDLKAMYVYLMSLKPVENQVLTK